MSENIQGSEGWLSDRCGIPTSSNFDKIITPTGKASSSANTYMNQLLAEHYIGKPVDQVDMTNWMERGLELEKEARDTYNLISGKEMITTNLCYLDEKKLIGASPDGFIDDDGLGEIKCPKASTMISYMLKGGFPAKYKPQVQGQLWITERVWCHFIAYHPDMEPFIIRVERDDRFIKLLSDEIECFIEEMLEKREQLKKIKAAA